MECLHFWWQTVPGATCPQCRQPCNMDTITRIWNVTARCTNVQLEKIRKIMAAFLFILFFILVLFVISMAIDTARAIKQKENLAYPTMVDGEWINVGHQGEDEDLKTIEATRTDFKENDRKADETELDNLAIWGKRYFVPDAEKLNSIHDMAANVDSSKEASKPVSYESAERPAYVPVNRLFYVGNKERSSESNNEPLKPNLNIGDVIFPPISYIRTRQPDFSYEIRKIVDETKQDNEKRFPFGRWNGLG